MFFGTLLIELLRVGFFPSSKSKLLLQYPSPKADGNVQTPGARDVFGSDPREGGHGAGAFGVL